MKDIYKQHFFEIIKKYRLGKASQEEIDFLMAYYKVFEENEVLNLDLTEEDAMKERILSSINKEINALKPAVAPLPLSKKIVKYYPAAAILLVLLTISSYFVLKFIKTDVNKVAVANEIGPGSNRAVLTLANGKKILLDQAANGEIAKQPGISITKTANGQIIYTILGNEDQRANPALSNTISTPKSGQYQVLLPDGTRVWLNSVSSLRYPTAFTGGERVVELQGEAYFEVAKDKTMPFKVKTALETIEVLGTHFNINAYEDEPTIKTTLLEGAVRVTVKSVNSAKFSGSQDLTLEPGQQAVLRRANMETALNTKVNVDKVVAWKNGVFSFENDDLRSVMRQIERWYDVKIVYEGPSPEDKFFGEISRNSNLSEVFKILELNNVEFNVSGKTVRVSAAN
ncbi:FecR domain-containing protein [Pedobacter sp. MC2016-14]|uniref:FecR family protein n=1 Tax=Pedobacter sp. MC2016-14 TaxID=2897327 RepID=UPI001E5FE9BE|nr:FecR family protein [Pedobacter sp. MC2016-14]MCD0490489.1 FecR domain-containing protein [Pedobacter sp. MC2016-14]